MSLSIDSAKTPIHPLPSDILIEIFRSYLQVSDWTQAIIPGRVCRHWRQIFITTPELHRKLTVVILDTQPSYLSYTQLLLERSGSYPLDLTFLGGASSALWTSRPILGEVLETAPRWRSLKIETDLVEYRQIRRELSELEMPILSDFSVDLRSSTSNLSSARPGRALLPPLQAPNLQNLRLKPSCAIDDSTFELATFAWGSLRTFEGPIGDLAHIFRVLTWGTTLRECSIHPSVGFAVNMAPSTSYDIPQIITNLSLTHLSIKGFNNHTTRLLNRLTLPSLTALSISSHSSSFLLEIKPFFRRIQEHSQMRTKLQKLSLKFATIRENRGIYFVLQETPGLKELELDRLTMLEIRQLLITEWDLLPELEVLVVQKSDDRLAGLVAVHELLQRRMVGVGGKLKTFRFKEGYSEGLMLDLTSKCQPWISAVRCSGFAQKLDEGMCVLPLSDEGQLALKDILEGLQSRVFTGSDILFSHLHTTIKVISELDSSKSMSNGDQYGIIPLSKTLLEECISKVDNFVLWLSRQPIIPLLVIGSRDEIRYHRVGEDENERRGWYARLSREAWADFPKEFPVPSVFQLSELVNAGRVE
ncbi:hypothetical protein BDN72DRAFT_959537 [Pluteus cervinus]|uniref:Uncharacterized protein n=1 Tax=Pluteus cervinus TaxID=181527 RepID=A0ACD3AUN8_9AGAR|nr:hypothetical protein BDN72DRAFT_959537 [Pluteus cervinus]